MADRQSNIESVFFAALGKPLGAERQAFLDEACGADLEFRAAVDKLLAEHSKMGNFLAIGDDSGAVIGPYTLLHRIAAGGMGVVYVAEQSTPICRQVALKLIKPGMDSEQVILRFEAERQALARMDHPHICKIFDAGTTQNGRPYFVMELIKQGIPITEYCDQRLLGLRERLELYIPVCQAVQHAHQKGIIHQDIKPTNILVELHDGKPVPKVIDFGLARAISGEKLIKHSLFTDSGGIAGTPFYMAPEQAEYHGRDVDTRADVYALGAVLYELLTGSTPIQRETLKKAALDEILRLVRESAPPPPSKRLSSSDSTPNAAANRKMEPKILTGLVRGDLDCIAMKALEKDRARRYESANGFMQDIQRFLADEPIIARPPSNLYAFQKFVRRHRRAAITASVVLITIVAGVVGTVIGLIEARKGWSEANQARLAEANEHKEVLAERDKKDKARQELVTEQLARAEERAASEKRDAETKADLAANKAIALERSNEARRQALIRNLRDVRLSPHADGWSASALKLAEEAAGLRVDADLQGQATAVFCGLDANALDNQRLEEFKSRDGSSVAFDPTGKRLAIGGAERWPGHGRNPPRNRTPASVWDFEAAGRSAFARQGTGPVAWSTDKALQAVVDPDDCFRVLLCYEDRNAEREFRISGRDKAVPLSAKNSPIIALAADGKTLAAFASLPEQGGTLAVWNTDTGEIIRQERLIESAITAIAIDGTGTIVAAGDVNGGISVWPLPAGEPISLPSVQREAAVLCLAMQRSRERREREVEPWAGWLLSAGHYGGNLLLWDIGTRTLKWNQSGATYGVYASAFSPDGTTVAAGGRGPVKLWDVATGRLLLGAFMGDYCTGLAFSPDGSTLAASNITVYGGEGGVFVRKLQQGRGIQTLRGLSGQVSRVCISPGAQYVAALVHDWRVAIWRASTGELLHILNVPRGKFIDNADMVFSPTGDRFAFSTHVQATVWNVSNGTLIGKPCELPIGLHDALAFDRAGKRLILCRIESQSGLVAPYGRAGFDQDPRVCHVRDLLSEQPERILARSDNLNMDVPEILATPDGYYMLTRASDHSPAEFVTEIYSTENAKRLFQTPSTDFSRIDPTGRLPFVLHGKTAEYGELIDIATRKKVGDWNNHRLRFISPNAEYGVGGAPDGTRGFSLWQRGTDKPLVSLSIDFDVTAIVTPFSDTGEFLALGHGDGTVSLCNIPELRQALMELGLGWEQP